jgi:hypothetical protein
MRNMINLLPPSLRRQQIMRKRVIQWSTVTCAVLLVGWIMHWYEVQNLKAQDQRLEVLVREHQPTQSMMQQLVDMRQELVDLQQQELIARELEHQRNALVLLGVISQTAQKTNGRLRVTKLELSDFQNFGSRSGANESGQGGAVLVGGVSLDNPAVLELLDGLQDSGIFSHVVLLASKERKTNDISVRDYELRCEF